MCDRKLGRKKSIINMANFMLLKVKPQAVTHFMSQNHIPFSLTVQLNPILSVFRVCNCNYNGIAADGAITLKTV